MIRLASPRLEVVIDEGRGAQIVRLGRPGGPNRLAWIDSDWPLRASAGGSYGSADLAWLSEHRGGWQEMFPNAGASCTVDGIPHPVHGESSMAPWEVVEASGGLEVTLRGRTHTPLTVTRRIFLEREGRRLVIVEEIHNPSELAFPYAWGHHPAFDAPPGTRLELAGARFEVDAGFDGPEADLRPGAAGAWPQAESRGGASVDLGVMPDHPAERVVYLTELVEPRARILRPDTADRLTLEWSAEAFPFAWLWVNRRATRFPWFGRLSAMAVEPVNVRAADGLAAAAARGQAPVLAGGETQRGWLAVSLSGGR